MVMKLSKTYASIDDYIDQAPIANQNGAQSGDIFDEAITILEHMKQIAGATNVVDIAGGKPMDITEEEYNELIDWLESLDKTRH